MIIRRPFGEFKFPNQHGFEPPAFLHLLGSQSLAPASASRFRQIDKGTVRSLESSKPFGQLHPRKRREAVASPGHVNQIVSLVITEDQSVESAHPNRVPTDDELLSLINAHLSPGTRSLARFVETTAAFRHQTFQPLRTHRIDQF